MRVRPIRLGRDDDDGGESIHIRMGRSRSRHIRHNLRSQLSSHRSGDDGDDETFLVQFPSGCFDSALEWNR